MNIARIHGSSVAPAGLVAFWPSRPSDESLGYFRSSLQDWLQRERFVALEERAVAHRVGEHDGGELALFGVFERHEGIKPECARKETTDLPG